MLFSIVGMCCGCEVVNVKTPLPTFCWAEVKSRWTAGRVEELEVQSNCEAQWRLNAVGGRMICWPVVDSVSGQRG
jgi:hypothetical protein